MSMFGPAAPSSGPLFPPQPPSTSQGFFQRMLQLQAQQPVAANPAYQPQPSKSLFASLSDGVSPPSQTTTSLWGNTYALPSTKTKIVPDLPAAESCRTHEPVDPSQTLDHFHLFQNLPVEIIGCIIEQCASADGVCLSLTSKHLYALARPILLRRSPDSYSLTSSPHHCSLRIWERLGHSACPKPTCRAKPRRHCLCNSLCPLEARLQSWMPPTLKYCAGYHCRKFKLRSNFHKGRCLHGFPKPRKRPEGRGSLTWTHHKGRGGWQHRGEMWRSLYTETNMAVCQKRYQEERKTESGYSLRSKPKPTLKRLEHRHYNGIRGSAEESEEFGHAYQYRGPTKVVWMNRTTGEFRNQEDFDPGEGATDQNGDWDLVAVQDDDERPC